MKSAHAVFAVGCGLWALGSGVSDAQGDVPFAKVRAWVEHVERHVPGTIDDEVSEVRSWNRTDLLQVRQHLPTLLRLMRDPDATFYFYTRIEPMRPGAPRDEQTPYRPEEREALRRIAREAAAAGDGNRLVKRAAMLHADIAMRAPPDVELTRTQRGSTALRQRVVEMVDGRSVAITDSVDHWDMARALLDAVTVARPDRPDPARDAFVRAWYRAFAADMIGSGRLVLPHFDRGARLFADDAVMLLLAGAMHETLAAPVVQGADLSVLSVRPARDELAQAAALFLRALAADPLLAEARIRLGHVLTQLGRAADALKELNVDASAAPDARLRYYGALFRGIAAEATGDFDLARRSYDAALALYPHAQSPRIALSQLAYRQGDRRSASDAVSRVFHEPAADDDPADPWWRYLNVAGRDAEAQIAELSEMLEAGDRR